MRNLLFIIVMGFSAAAYAVDERKASYDDLALNHVEKFVSLYGEKSITIKKHDGKKYTKLRAELETCATAEVLTNILDDQEEFSTDLSFALSILFSTEATSNHVRKVFNKDITYSILEKSETEAGMKYLISRADESKLLYEVECSETKVKGLFGLKHSKDSCLITKVSPKDL